MTGFTLGWVAYSQFSPSNGHPMTCSANPPCRWATPTANRTCRIPLKMSCERLKCLVMPAILNFEKPLFYPVVSGLSVRLQTTRRPILLKRNFTKLFKIESYDNTT